MAPGLPAASKYASTVMPACSGMIPCDPRRHRRGAPGHAERRYLDPAKREASGHDSGDRDADHGEHDVDPVQREAAFSEGRSGERHLGEQPHADQVIFGDPSACFTELTGRLAARRYRTTDARP